MTLLRILFSGLAFFAGAAHADSSFTLYSNGASGQHNRFIVHPGAWRNKPVSKPMTPQPRANAQPRPAPSTYNSHIQAAATETNVDAALIRAVISVESGYNPSARSNKGALGLMQLMPQTAERYGVKDRLDPEQNIKGGARYLRDLKAMFGNDLQLVLAAYNAGEEAVIKYGRRIPPYRETVDYVPKVLGHYTRSRTGG
jgi:soluble lytic murein transglycosylase-like protein